jgi:2OG-Fe(II) oxygenase superfamily
MEARLTRQRWTARVADGSYPTLTRVSVVPRVWVVDGFATQDECAYAVGIGAEVESGGAGADITTKHDSTGFSFEMPIAGEPLLERLDRRIQDTMGVADVFGCTFRFRRYKEGEAHPAHTDVWDGQVGWLVGTAMLCLVAPEAGGSTDFVLSVPPLSVPARVGRLAIWANHLPNGAPDDVSRHLGAPVQSGEKITITRFVYRPLQGDPFVQHGLRDARPW